MKRSAGVTVASTCVIAASVAWCAYVIWLLRLTGKEGLAIIFAEAIFMLLFGVWGIATGVALLRLRRWAWLCILVISAAMIFLGGIELLRAPKLIRATTGVTTVGAGHFISSQYFDVIALGIVPFVLGIWWLVFFLRRSVRAQFSSGATLRASGENPPITRSGAVDASAIVLLFGCAFVLRGAIMVPLAATMPQTTPAPPFPLRRVLITAAVFYLLIAAWGVVTGVGVLKRRAWGRILMIVTAVLGVAFCVLGSVGIIMAMLVAPPNPSSSEIRAAIIGTTAVLLMPLGACTWWLVLCTRRRIATEFASPTFGAAAAPLIALPHVSAENEAAASVPVQFNASVVSREAAAPTQMPVSIRVIAVVEILFGAMAFLGLAFLFSGMTPGGLKPPLLIFGFLAHGWGIVAFYIVSGIIPITVCAAILLRKRWGLDTLVVFMLAEIANSLLFFISPARARFNSEMLAQIQKFMAQIKMPAGSPPPTTFPLAHMMLFQGIDMGVTIVLYLVLLYFLFTRRRAFRAACQPLRSSPV